MATSTTTSTSTTQTTPTPSQYQYADWMLSATDPSVDLVRFDIVGGYAQAVYLAIHRVTNSGPHPVNVETDKEILRLEVGNSIDVSATQVRVTQLHSWAGGGPSKGTYMLLCCTLAVGQGAQPKKDPSGHGGCGGGSSKDGAVSGGDPTPTPPTDPTPPNGLDALEALKKEVARIRAKLKIAREHGEDAAAKNVEGLLAILEREIGKAAIAEARREMDSLGKAVHDLGGGSQ